MSDESPVRRMRALTSAAVIGTDRSSGRRTPADVLTAVAIAGAQARAGRKARRVSGELARRPDDARPIANGAAMATLARLLADSDAGLIEEWAELAQARGVRVADATAPLLLDWWARQPSRPGVVFAVLGKVGEWLATLNPVWRKPVAGSEIPGDADNVWQSGTVAERSALLKTIRRVDAERARQMVQSTWADDGAEERRKFVEVLAEGCSMSDEPFLESALDDKSKVVRRQAAAALRLIPESRFRARMNERAREIVIVEGKRGILNRRPKVVLHPPVDFRKEWARDGIEEQAAGGVGKRAWWIRQILAAADLPLWNEITGLEPDGVIEAIGKDDYFDDALHGMIQAVEFSGNTAWCRALQRCLLDRDKTDMQALHALWAGLPSDQREPLVLEAVDHKRFDAESRWSLLALGKERWSDDFSIKAVKILKKNKPGGDAWRLHESVDRISRRISPIAAAAFEEALTALSPVRLPDSLARSVDRVRLRADMHKEFT